MSSRSYRDPVIKKLFALSHNVCAFPGCDVKLADTTWPTVQARICHIYGLNWGSVRYVDWMTDDERNDYPNLLLLCPNHHATIDELEPAKWSADRLLELKEAHERQAVDDRLPPELVVRAVAALIALYQSDYGVELLDPASGVRVLLTNAEAAGEIEARYFGEATPVPIEDDSDWIGIGFTVNKYLDLLVARALEAEMPVEDLSQLRHLRSEASSAFNRIPAN